MSEQKSEQKTIKELVSQDVMFHPLISGRPVRVYSQYVSPQSGSSFGLGERISFKITSSNALLNGKNSYLRFKMVITNDTAGALTFLLGRGSSVIKSVRTYSSSTEFENIADFALVDEVIHTLSSGKDYQETVQASSGRRRID